ncbi:hypothetical protein [Alkalihalobacillus sp. 1P02AB]|uniref:hypothetical protein n=1 Tax=Alkalihalobacillus sp. 1P02AB TaxID=3132260 RepID=UPI0039A58934
MPKHIGLINDNRSEKENVLFLSAGGEISPSLMSGLWFGEHMIVPLNEGRTVDISQ